MFKSSMILKVTLDFSSGNAGLIFHVKIKCYISLHCIARHDNTLFFQDTVIFLRTRLVRRGWDLLPCWLWRREGCGVTFSQSTTPSRVAVDGEMSHFWSDRFCQIKCLLTVLQQFATGIQHLCFLFQFWCSLIGLGILGGYFLVFNWLV